MNPSNERADSSALLRPVEEAKSAGIPTVIFDSALADTTKQVSYVSTDNGKGGRLAGKRMGELLGPLHNESYLHVDEVRGDAYGFGGLTQERRYIVGQLEVAPQRAAA